MTCPDTLRLIYPKIGEAIMDVKEVTKTAREHVAEIFADEQIANLGL